MTIQRQRTATLALAVFTAAIAVASSVSTSAQRAPAPPSAITVWRIDPTRSDVRFTVTKLGFEDVTGVFRESGGEIRFDPARIEASSIQWRVRVASVKTDASNRDRSLQSPDYFDAATNPYLSFASRTVRAASAGALEVAGDITIRGVTKPLTITVRPQRTDAGPTFTTDFELDRYDFGVVGGSIMGRLIGARVRVHLMAATVAD
jgi:polyisoprenoid-binding protein YceI